jgi:uncharacterized membrane-anchored protein
MRNTALTLVLASLVLAPLPSQQDGSNPGHEPRTPGTAAPEPDPAESHSTDIREMLEKYHPTEGTVKVGTVAEARLTNGWLFLAGANARRFLLDLGNQPGPQVLGVAMPPDFAESKVFAVYSYADEGHVGDDENPNYDELLTEMQESAKESSKQRKTAGLGGVELLGWAEPPHYDKEQHKLYWAEKLKFDESAGLTLNYNVRVLGRTGHLVVNGVGDIDQLEIVADHSKHLLTVTEFLQGQRYENFDPAYDKVAAYGIGGLIAGSIAMKAGLFAKLAVLLKVALKPILVGLAVIGGAIMKVFRRRKQPQEVQATEAS